MPQTLLACALAASAFVLLCSSSNNVNAQEILNLELICKGTVEPQFNDPEMLQRYRFRQTIPSTFTPNKFDERVTIRNNTFEGFPLKISDTKIEFAEDVTKTLAEAGIDLFVELDRLTGKLSGEGLFNTKEAIAALAESQKEVMGMVGVAFSGECEKLDPKKKLF